MSGFGISFGNTSAYVALAQNGDVSVIANSAGERSTSTVVALEEGEVLTATPALQMQTRQPQNAVGNLKNLIQPEKFEHACKGQACKFEGDKDDVKVSFQNSTKKSVSTLINHIFQNLKETADSSLGNEKHEVVLAVPLSASNNYKDLLKSCATSAGFDVVDMIPEPIAALLYYESSEPRVQNGHQLVVRVGGQSTDVSLIKSSAGLYSVVAHNEDFIGGTKFDKEIGKFLCNEFNKKHRVRIEESVRSISKLLRAARETKHMLTLSNTAECRVESLYEGIDMCTPISRPRFETLIQGDITKLMNVIRSTRSSTTHDIGTVVLCGSGSLVSKLSSLISSEFPNSLILNRVPGEVVVQGAARHLLTLHSYPEARSKLELEEMGGILTASLSTVSEEIAVVVDGKDNLVIRAGTPLPHHTQMSLAEGAGGSLAVRAGQTTLVESKIPEDTGDLDLQLEISETGTCELVLKDCGSGERSTMVIPVTGGS